MTTTTPNRSVFKDLVMLAGFAIVVCAILWFFSGRMAVEKLVTRLVAPVGVIWLSLFGIAVMAFRRQQKGIAWSLLAVWFWLTISGNGTLSDLLMTRLEADYLSTVPADFEKFDSIIVMGGGAGLAPNGQPQTNGSGGRIVTAAQMFRLGLVRRIICGGGRIPSMTRVTMNESQKTATLLMSLGVPESAIQLASGENSTRELQDIANRMDPNERRLGLITSAWHLPRAMRLAKKYGLDPVAIPADFRSPVVHDEPPLFGERVYGLVPKGGGLEESAVAIKEYIAHIVGR